MTKKPAPRRPPNTKPVRAEPPTPVPLPTAPLADEWYKLENGQRVPMTAQEIQDFIDHLPPPLPPTAPPEADANARIDRALQAAYDALPPRIDISERAGGRMSAAEEQEYLVGVSDALRALLAGLRVIQPRSN